MIKIKIKLIFYILLLINLKVESTLIAGKYELVLSATFFEWFGFLGRGRN